MTPPDRLRVAYTLEQLWHDVPGGTATAALELARQLAIRDDVELLGVAGRHARPPAAAFTPPVAVRALPIARPWLYETWNRCNWPFAEAATGPVDVCHSTTGIPAATRAAHVVTIHDASFVVSPEHFTRHGVRVMTRGLERARAADLVITPSRATADELLGLGFDEARLRVVPWGVAATPVTPADVAGLRRARGLPERFVLFVGTLEPRKNLARLAQAVARLDPPLPLVVAGAEGWGDAAPTAGDVRFLGFVPHDELGPLYAAATVFAYPSLHEGFGLPVAEAMAYGAPVVTSLAAATAEVAGGAAVLVDPTSVDSIADGLRAALADPDGWRARGVARAADLTWERTAEATVAVYREALRAHVR